MNLYRVKYVVFDYDPGDICDAHGDVREEIVADLGLTRIQYQARDDPLTVILEVQMLRHDLLPDMKRTVEYVNANGNVEGTETTKRAGV